MLTLYLPLIYFFRHTGDHHHPHDPYRSNPRNASLPDESVGMNDLNIMFSPAEHTDSMKRRKERKKQRQRERADLNSTPRAKNSSKNLSSAGSAATHPSSASTASTKSESRQGTPPPRHRPPKAEAETTEMATEDEDVWYAKWWMFCFPDTVKSMAPKR